MWQKPKKQLTTLSEAQEFALKLLDQREYGSRELTRRLLLKGASEDLARQVVAQLKEHRLLDEERYAQAVFTAWRRKKVYGSFHLQAELHKKQVAEQFIPVIMQQLTAAEEEERALAAAQLGLKRQDGKFDCTTQKGVAALVRFLTTRGFSGEAIRHVLVKVRADLCEQLSASE
jgi:regulatory protein